MRKMTRAAGAENMRKMTLEAIAKSRLTAPMLLAFQLGLHLLLYFNTEVFAGISESGVLLGKLGSILEKSRQSPCLGVLLVFYPGIT